MSRAVPVIAAVALGAAAVLAYLLLASDGEGARPAREAEAQGVFEAMQRHAPQMPIACVPLQVKVSTRDTTFASAAVSRTLTTCAWGDGEYLLRYSGSRWDVVAEGTEHACTEAPRAVLDDLFGGCV